MGSTAPECLLPNFDPSKCKIPALRSILLRYGVPYPPAGKKSELVAAYEAGLRPRAPALLAEFARVEPSDVGILDGESAEGSLKELDTDSGAEADVAPPTPATVRKNKAGVTKVRTKKAPVKVDVDMEDGELDEELEVSSSSFKHQASGKVFTEDEKQQPAPRKPRKSSVQPSEVARPVNKRRLGSHQPEEPQKRAKQEPTSAEKDRLNLLKYDSGGDTSFSDYNPFQSGDDRTPDKRRKSMPGQARRSSMAPPKPVASGSGASPRKSMPATLPSALHRDSWANDSEVGGSPAAVQERLVPSRAAPRQSHSPGVGVRYALPVEKARVSSASAALEASAKKSTVLATERGAGGDRDRAKERERAMELDDVLNLPEDMELDQLEAELEAEERRRSGPSSSYASPAESPIAASQHQARVQPQPQPQAGSSGLKWSDTTPGRAFEGLRTELRKTPHPHVGRVGSGRGGSDTVEVATRDSSEFESSEQDDDDFIDDVGEDHRLGEGDDDFADDFDEDHQLVKAEPSTTTSRALHATAKASKWLTLITLLLYALWFREEKVAAGFCDNSSSSNALIRTRTATRSVSLALDGLPSAPPGVLALLDAAQLRPTCTPCPAHGVCRSGAFSGCISEYIASPHPLSFGGLLPLAPTCEPDREKLKAVAVQASKIAKMLRVRKGRVVCDHLEKARRKTGKGEAFVFGIQGDAIMDILRRENELSEAPYDEATLDDISRLAIIDLQDHGDAISSTEAGTLWLASEHAAELPLSCRARLAATNQLDQHKTGLASVLTALLAALYLRSSFRSNQSEKARVRELVQLALNQLRKQERLHYNDPVITPAAHIAPSHLRDLLLQAEHSPTRRQQLWNKVEKVVETNSNVRVKEVEIDGEPIRAWLWSGFSALEDGGAEKTESLYPKLLT